MNMVKKSSIFRYKPEKMMNGDNFYCTLCRWDYPRNHIHFDFSIQSVLDFEESNTEILNEYNLSEVKCVCLVLGIEKCEVNHLG